MVRWYLSQLRVRAYSAFTIEGRERQLRVLADWLTERGVNRVTEADRAHLLAYQRHLARPFGNSERPLDPATQGHYLTAVRRFFAALLREGYVSVNPAADLESPRQARRLPREVLTPSEVERVLATCDTETAPGIRDRTLLELLWATGIRRTEALQARVTDVDFERDLVIVREGKGRKDRLVPLGPRAAEWIRRYLEEGRPHLIVDDVPELFVTDEGRRFKPTNLTGLVHRRILRAEIGKSGACHVFRHSMATSMLEAGCDVRLIQAILGHANLATTAIYTHVTIGPLIRAHRRFHPAFQPIEAELPEEVPSETGPGAFGGSNAVQGT